jgi:competence protein ComEC
VRARIVAALQDAWYAGVIVALTIGEQRAIPEAQWRVFNRTGIGHLISISGLHVTVFASIAGSIALALARRSVALTTRVPARRIAAAAGLLFATAYTLLAGAQVPAVRTLLMLAVAAIGIMVARPGTAAIVWLWALAAVLIWDPWAGLTPGFWLSFGAVGVLLYAGVGRLNSAAPPTAAPRAVRTLRAAAYTQGVVTVALVPGTLALFQQVSLVSPLANALAIPVVTFAVVPLALSAIVLPIDLLWKAAHAVFAVLMIPLEWLAALPDAAWQQHAPADWAIVVALAGVMLLAAPRGVPGRALGVVALLPLFVVRPVPPAPGAFRMTVLDVGQGLAVVVETHTHALLYDTGPRYTDDADAGGRIVAPYLRATGVERLSALIVTHQDADHSGGALSVLQVVPVEWFASSLPPDHAIAARRRADGGVPVRCEAGQSWTWDGVRFEVLQPTVEHYANPRLKPNDLSCVIRVDSDYGSALLTGDLEARGELETRAPRRRAAQSRCADRAASRQQDLVDARVHRRGRAADRRVHAGLSEPLRPSAPRHRRALRCGARAHVSHRLRRRVDVCVRAGRCAHAARRARTRSALLARCAGARCSWECHGVSGRPPRSSLGCDRAKTRGFASGYDERAPSANPPFAMS